MKRILLMVDNPGNRKVLNDFLGNKFELFVAKDDNAIFNDYDLCVLDASSFIRAKNLIHRKKDLHKPVFLPFILITAIDEFQSIASLSTHLIDELLLTPVKPDVMQTRIERMLEEQDNSITLKRTRDRAIEQLKRSNETLEKRVGERTREIAESQKLLRSIIDNSPAMIYLKDTEGRYILVNREYENAVGTSIRKIIGKTDYDIQPEEISGEIVANDKKVLDAKKAISFEEEVNRPDGIYTYLAVKFPVKNAEGDIYGLCGISTNITDRKRAEAALRAERRRLGTILAALPVGVLMADHSGQIYHANNKAKSIWGTGSLEKLNERKGHWADSGFELKPDDWGLRKSTLSGEASVGKVIEIERFDGSRATMLDSAAPLIDPRGQVEGAVAIIQDITEQYQRAKLSDALNNINNIIFSTIDFGEIMIEVLKSATAAIDCDAAAVGLLKEGYIEFEYACRLPRDIRGEKLSVAQTPAIAEVMKKRQPVLISDTFTDHRFNQTLVKKYSIKSIAIIPLMAQGNVFGIMSYYYTTEPKDFTQLQIDFLSKLGASLSLALQNSDLYNSMQRELTRIALLKEIVSAATSTLSIADACNEALEITNSYLDANTGSIYYYNKQQEVLESLAISGWPEEIVKDIKRISMDSDSNQARLIKHKLSLMTHESQDQAPASQERLRKAGLANNRWFIIPIIARRELIGSFSLAFDGLRPFSIDELSLYRSIAEQLGVAIENARLFESEVAARSKARDELEVSNALRQTADNLAISLDIPDIFDSLAGTVIDVTGIKRVTVNLRDEVTGEITIVSSKGEEAFQEGAEFQPGELPTVVRNAWQGTKPVIIDSESPEVAENEREIFRASNVRLILFVPIVLGGRTVAFITASDPGQEHAFLEKERRIIEGMASQAAIAIERARFYAALQEELVRVNILKDAAAVASSAMNIDQITGKILGIIEERLDLKAGSIHYYNKDANILSLLKATKDFEQTIAQLGDIEVNEDTFMGQIVITGKEQMTHETPGQTETIKELAKRMGIESDRWIIMAIPVRDQVVGVMNLVFEGKRPFDYAEISLYHSIAEQLGVAIENARLYEAEVAAKKRAASELEISKLLGKTSQILATAVEMPKLIRKLGDLGDIICRFTGRSRVMISLIDHQKRELKVVAVSGRSNIKIGTQFSFNELAYEFRQKIMAEKRSVILDYEKITLSKDKKLLGDFDIKRGIAVPITAKGQTIASILVDEPGNKVDFKEREIRLVESLASQLSVALERARLYEAERTIADTLQTALLSIPETIKGIEFSHTYRSATELAQVGGDFYDLFELEHDKVGILLGDVSGKGLSAAALTSLVKNIVKAYALEGEPPGKIMSRTNDIVYRESSSGTFVTVFMGILDLQTGKLSYCNAGHPPPVLKKALGDTVFVNDTSPVIGVFKSYSYPVSETSIGIGDALVLYTDGVIEARRGKKFYGDDRLLNTVTRSKAETRDLTAEIFKNVNDFTDGNLTDDLAIVTLSLSKEPAAAQTPRAA